MLKRPEYNEKELKDLELEASEAADEVMARAVQFSKTEGELSHSVTFNEYVAINVLKNIAVNVVMQNKGTLTEYLDFVKAEITKGYEVMSKEELKPFEAGGKEISTQEMIKSAGHEVH